MDRINDKTKSIEEAISIIDQIAFQTNILSLNVCCWSKTAGEAGTRICSCCSRSKKLGK